MSDEGSPVADDPKKKRGRPSKLEKTPVKEAKKRGRAGVDKNNTSLRGTKSDTEDDGTPGPVKKGRGRPKGSFKKKAAPPKGPSGRGRGRPRKKEEKAESTGEEEEEQEDEEEEEEED